MGLIHPVLSYNGHLSIAFTSCRSMLPDPAAYATCLQQSFDELVRALRGRPSRKAVAETSRNALAHTQRSDAAFGVVEERNSRQMPQVPRIR